MEGVVSFGDVVKDRIGQMGQQTGFLPSCIRGSGAWARWRAHGRAALPSRSFESSEFDRSMAMGRGV
jgi:hypothetical protein